MRRTARLANSEYQIVRTDRFLPHLKLIEAIFGGPDDQSILGGDLEAKFLRALYVLEIIVRNVRAILVVKAMSDHGRSTLRFRRSHAVADDRVAHQADVRFASELRAFAAIAIGEALDDGQRLHRISDPSVRDTGRATKSGRCP